MKLEITLPLEEDKFYSPNLQTCEWKKMAILGGCHRDRSVNKTPRNTRCKALIKRGKHFNPNPKSKQESWKKIRNLKPCQRNSMVDSLGGRGGDRPGTEFLRNS